jgi:hypothetical protein
VAKLSLRQARLAQAVEEMLDILCALEKIQGPEAARAADKVAALPRWGLFSSRVLVRGIGFVQPEHRSAL